MNARRYSKILLKFTVGGMQAGGAIEVQCKCGERVKLTTENHYCNGITTFRSEVTHERVTR